MNSCKLQGEIFKKIEIIPTYILTKKKKKKTTELSLNNIRSKNRTQLAFEEPNLTIWSIYSCH